MYNSWDRMKREAARQATTGSTPRNGIISSYDPKRYAVKVQIMPEAAFPELPGGSGETGWIPLGTAWAGKGWGDYAPPDLKTQVHVSHQEGSTGVGVVQHQLFDRQHAPLSVASGERWIVHKSGSFVKWTNAGELLLHANHEVKVTVGNVQIDAMDGRITTTVGSSKLEQIDGKATITVGGAVAQLQNDRITLNIGPALVDMLNGQVTIAMGGAVLTWTADRITSSVPIHAPSFPSP